LTENSKPPGDKYDRLKEPAITALLSHSTVEQAADVAGLSPSTLYRWLKTEDFLESFRQARQETVKLAMVKLQQSTSSMVDVLVGIAKDESKPSGTRVNAAKTVLEASIKVVEMEEIIERLKKIETKISEGGNYYDV